jgi:hypothetical protein
MLFFKVVEFDHFKRLSFLTLNFNWLEFDLIKIPIPITILKKSRVMADTAFNFDKILQGLRKSLSFGEGFSLPARQGRGQTAFITPFSFNAFQIL